MTPSPRPRVVVPFHDHAHIEILNAPAGEGRTRIPDNGGTNYPYAEVVLLNCRLEGYEPEAWTVQPPPWDSSNVKFYEYNSKDLNGRPLDVSKRHPVSKQLTLPKDAATIANYSKPEFVLGGWKPVVL